MPIHDLGYRPWEGTRTARLFRLMVVATTGIALVWRGPWLRRLMLFAWVPVLPTGAGFLVYEQSLVDPSAQRAVATVLLDFLRRPDLAAEYLSDPAGFRREVWAAMLLTFFRHPQALTMVVLFGLTAPRLISYDLRSRAYLLYFSRPLVPLEYIAGKALVLAFLLSTITTIPALAVYVLGLLLSPDPGALAVTWDLPIRIVVATLVLAIPTSAVALCYSSMTTESRYATFAWFATWVLGWVAYGALTSGELLGSNAPRTVGDGRPETADTWRLVSPYHTLGELQAVAFGVTDGIGEAIPSIVLVCSVTVAALAIVYHRVAGQLRI